ncbi:MAG: NAD(P)/FAD-dependent oxidoreductase [Parachlamydiales bacterium]|jgi:phytoene dehydrogenase-like protein
MKKYDAIIIGSGPNGLAAGITLAEAGLTTAIFEAKDTPGGGMRSAELTLPGFTHDICSAIHPLGIGSPFFRTLPLEKYGLTWKFPVTPLAHPFDDGTAAILDRSLETTIQSLGIDGTAYQKLMGPLIDHWDILVNDLLAPLHFPQHPIALAQFGLQALRSAQGTINSNFKAKYARGLFIGLAAHCNLPLDKSITAAFAFILGTLGHVIGWPTPEGGSQKLANALAAYYSFLGGQIFTGHFITSLDELPPSKTILCDISPKQLLDIAGDRLPSKYKQKLQAYRYGPGVCKVDWALNAPIPWKSKECQKAGTIHLGGEAESIILSEKEVWEGKHPEKPYVLIAQQSLFDLTRAPQGKHTAWGYCHVPRGSERDMTQQIEGQIERFAPGFRDCILARHVIKASEMENYNPNYVGGDINGGVQDIYQLFKRPTSYFNPYSTPVKGLYLCSSSTPPGGGVHGMCGYHAAQAVLKNF